MKEERIITPTEIRFDKTQCGVDFLLNTGPGYEHAAIILQSKITLPIILNSFFL